MTQTQRNILTASAADFGTAAGLVMRNAAKGNEKTPWAAFEMARAAATAGLDLLGRVDEQKTVCSCGCGTVVMIGNQAQGDITDGFVFESDGSLDFIELFVAGHDRARGAFRMTGRGIGDFTVFAVDRFDAFAVARATNPGVPDIGILSGPGLCPGCCGDGIKSAVPNVLTCRSCGGAFTDGPITLDAARQVVAVDQPMLANAGDGGQFLFDFVVFDVILADGKTTNRLHGWADRQTKRVVQWG